MDRGDASGSRPWDSLLIEHERTGTLVEIARQRRLVLEDGRGPQWVDLCWVDEAALALVDLAIRRGQGIDLVYPAPAGSVAVLLAAQVLLGRFLATHGVRGAPSPSLGLVTGDPTQAERIWRQLRIATLGDRAPIEEVLACFRAGPDGESPVGGRRITGIIIGQTCGGWPVDSLVVDHLSGYVDVGGNPATIEVFADPRDPALASAERDGRLLWGWSDSEVARCNANLEVRRDYTVPFSVATERLDAIARGVHVTVSAARHPDAEAALARVREDLRLLRTLAPDRSSRHVERGLSAAWHHLSTLTSLPCEPSRFDRFAGLPPWAARATRTFEPELTAWARTLSGDQAEIATILASDIGDLRAALDDGNPIGGSIRELAGDGPEALVVTRTRTASRALLDALGADPDGAGVGQLSVCAIGRLHRQGTWPRAVVLGEPPPWDWHRLLSGLSTDVTILTLGQTSAQACALAVESVRAARERWGSPDVRGWTWRQLVGTEPPASPPPEVTASAPVILVEGHEYVPEPDAFEPFDSLFDFDPLDIGDEGPSSQLARQQDDGDWAAAVPAVAVDTDHGRVLLEEARSVEVRVGERIDDRRPLQLKPGDVLLIGRRLGRVGLLEALEERLGDRPDLMAARMLIDRYHQLVRKRFAESGLGIADLHRALQAQGCDKTSIAVRSWVTDVGIMAPRDREDLRLLCATLAVEMSTTQLDELYACVQRRRVFRRAAGRALAEAARSSTVVSDQHRVDPQTGLSIADLRDAVIEAVVVAVRQCDDPVPLTLLGRLEDT
ncbi:MAG: hypothetical protein M0Z46_18015 [Actinomycetota bacterium]|nr:hypothetical protein [Actinomycetota bacterium]